MIKGYSSSASKTKAAPTTAHTVTTKKPAPTKKSKAKAPVQSYKTKLQAPAAVTPIAANPLIAAYLQRKTVDTSTNAAAVAKAQAAIDAVSQSTGDILAPQDQYANVQRFANKLLLSANSATQGETDIKANQQTKLWHPKQKKKKTATQLKEDKMQKKDAAIPLEALPIIQTMLAQSQSNPTYYSH